MDPAEFDRLMREAKEWRGINVIITELFGSEVRSDWTFDREAGGHPAAPDFRFRAKLADSRISASVSLDSTGDIYASYESPRIVLTKEHFPIVVKLRVHRGLMTVYVNGAYVRRLTDADDPEVTVKVPKTPVRVTGHYQGIAWEHPDANTICSAWIAERTNSLAEWDAPRRDRTPRPMSAVIQDLEDAVDNLEAAVSAYDAGAAGRIQVVRGYLRSLLIWGGRNYTPLLLRVAGQFGLPLPLFGYRIDRKDGNATDALKAGAPILRTDGQPGFVMRDIQEWLGERYIEILPFGGSPGFQTTVSQIITESANILGMAHFDANNTPTLEFLEQNLPALLDRTLVNLAHPVIPLSRWVVAEARKRLPA